MRKKILMSLIISVLLVCVFAFSVNAESVHEGKVDLDATVTLSDGTVLDLFDEDGNALIWFIDSASDTGYSSIRADIGITTDANNKVDFQINAWVGTVAGGAYANQVDKVVITYNGSAVDTKNIVVFNIMDDDVVVTTTSKGRLGEPVNCFTGAFSSHTNLQYAYLRLDTVALQANVFNGCTALKYVNLPDLASLTQIAGGNTFNNCTSLFAGQELDLTGTALINCSGGSAFNKATFATIKLPDTVTNIDGYVFQYSEMTSFRFPSSLKSMAQQYGAGPFLGCSKLETVTNFENTQLTNICSKAFNGSAITSIKIPSTVTLIDDYAFQNCKSLKSVDFSAATSLETIDQAAFENCTVLESVTIPEGVTTLGNCAFNACSSLETLSLPTTLTTLSGNNHFKGSSLKEVIGLENTQLTSISFDMFRGQKNWKPEVLKLPNTVETISGQALADIGMKTLILSANLTSISSNALTNCLSLEVIYVPAGAPIAGTGNGLYDCNSSALKLIFFEGADATDIQTYENYTPITYAEYVENPDTYAIGYYIVTNTNKCVAFYNSEHNVTAVEGSTCCGVCDRCLSTQMLEDPVHTNEWVLVGTYITGYTASNTCVYCERVEESTAIAALFISKGYSCTVLDGAISIVQGFDINRDAVALYEELTGKEVSYGVVATSVNKVADGNIDVVNNVDGVTAIDFTSAEKKEFTRFEIKVADIAEANWETGLYACAYVIADGAVSFISENASATTATAKTAASILQENPV